MTDSKSHKRQKVEKSSWHVFPPKAKGFKVGQNNIIYRTRGDGEYQLGSIQRKTSAHFFIQDAKTEEEVQIDFKTTNKLLLPAFGFSDDTGTTLLVTPETSHFRLLVSLLKKEDRVLEIGHSSGEASRLIVPSCKSWVGFDTSEEMQQKCRQSLSSLSSKDDVSNCHTSIINALIDPKRASQEAQFFGCPTAIFIDIGGNREQINVLRMISWVLEEFSPRIVVIKSRELTNSIRSSNMGEDYSSGLVNDGDEWFRKHRRKRAIPKHPLKAPLVMSPSDPKKPICRYHNYHVNGCSKSDCQLDHEHCHSCLERGHIGRRCPSLLPKENN